MIIVTFFSATSLFEFSQSESSLSVNEKLSSYVTRRVLRSVWINNETLNFNLWFTQLKRIRFSKKSFLPFLAELLVPAVHHHPPPQSSRHQSYEKKWKNSKLFRDYLNENESCFPKEQCFFYIILNLIVALELDRTPQCWIADDERADRRTIKFYPRSL